jgi:hypothetical protein
MPQPDRRHPIPLSRSFAGRLEGLADHFLAMLFIPTVGATEPVSVWFPRWVIDQASARGQSLSWATYWPLAGAGVAYF